MNARHLADWLRVAFVYLMTAEVPQRWASSSVSNAITTKIASTR
jgi:hypothetical protein